MTKMYYGEDGNLNIFTDKRVAVIGYGSQGYAHALNLKDSGVDVVVGLYEGSKSWKKAESDGLTVMRVQEAVESSNRPVFNARKRQELEYPMVEVGKNIRAKMSWLKK